MSRKCSEHSQECYTGALYEDCKTTWTFSGLGAHSFLRLLSQCPGPEAFSNDALERKSSH